AGGFNIIQPGFEPSLNKIPICIHLTTYRSGRLLLNEVKPIIHHMYEIALPLFPSAPGMHNASLNIFCEKICIVLFFALNKKEKVSLILSRIGFFDYVLYDLPWNKIVRQIRYSFLLC
ncbi:hypothetical protein, partial [Siminovitchia terrae]|uniref:hypothetical protein n=1 Tax=Siminovitchia terrae TaxID=1914933 RepID=UPI0028A68E0B